MTGEVADEAIGDRSGHRQFVLPLEFPDGAARCVIEDAGRFDLAVAIV